jgi:N-acetylneuraminate synthase
MSTINQIDSALSLLKDSELVLLHCVSTYPAKTEELNLSVIRGLRDRYKCLVGYSGHEKGIMPSVIASVMYGACVIERHLTLDRSEWGSDQAASLEPQGFSRMVKYIGESKRALGDGQKRLLESEVLVKAKLRKVEDF